MMDVIERFLTERRLEKQGLQSVEPGDYVDLFIFHQQTSRLLLLQGERNPVFGRKSKMWGIVSETIEPDDNILLTACNRAIWEEVSCDSNLFRINFNSWSVYQLAGGEIVHRLMVFFLGVDKKENFSPQNGSEITAYQWVDLQVLINMTAARAVEPYVLPLARWFKFYENR